MVLNSNFYLLRFSTFLWPFLESEPLERKKASNVTLNILAFFFSPPQSFGSVILHRFRESDVFRNNLFIFILIQLLQFSVVEVVQITIST